MSFDMWDAGVNIPCIGCRKYALEVIAISNTETGLKCAECRLRMILQQGTLFWQVDDKTVHSIALHDYETLLKKHVRRSRT